MTVLSFVVPDEWDGRRVGEFLRQAHGVSGTTLKMAKRIENGITQDGAQIRTVDPVRAGAVIRLSVDEKPRAYRPLDLDVPVVYEDDDVLAFNKPAGLAVHPSLGHPCDTLANVFAARPSTAGLIYRPLGRLDRDTSGLVLVAKHAHAAYAAAITQKRYLALLCGALPSAEGTIEAPIGRVGEDTQRRCVRGDGQYAATRWHVLQSGGGLTLAELWLMTGRTHQIRVHMAHLGCPLAGDALYGGDLSLMQRQALHCATLSFRFPANGEERTLTAPLPDDFCAAIHTAFGGFDTL
jgi:23S rRNA pseudouridine1911/1915/1917 synthase